MTNLTQSAVNIDDQLAVLVEEITRKLEAGERFDEADYTHRFPNQVEPLRKLLPALEALVLAGRQDEEPQRGMSNSHDASAERHGQLGDFRLIHEIGRGGMGTVFEAEQMSMGRRVALKVLPFAALVQAKSLQRFRNEVRAAAALDHPHIVSVYSIGEERGVHFYAMQLIRGQTLADMISELRTLREALSPCPPIDERAQTDEAETVDSSIAPLPSTKRDEQGRVSTAVDPRRSVESYRMAARLGIQAADALQHAHEQGVLHRDIKPSNLMLDAERKLYVTDFGLARIEADAGMTMTGDIVGTLRYMAPEQALAKRVVIDHRADIYSLGATLYELLTLQPAFGETDRSELLKHIAFEEPIPLRKIDRRIPYELETIVLTAMAKNPNERYQASTHLGNDLRAFLENKPINAKPPNAIDRLRKWAVRNRAVATVLITGITLVAVIATLSGSLLAVAYRNEQHQLRLTEAAAIDAVRERKRAMDSLQTEKTSRALAEVNLYHAHIREAEQSLRLGHTSHANTLLYKYALSNPAMRDWEWYYLLTLASKDSVTVGKHDQGVQGVKWQPRGHQLASVSSDSLRIWDAHHVLLHDIRIPYAFFRAVAYSRDGARIATAGLDNCVRIFEVATGRQVAMVRVPDDVRYTGFAFEWSPDDRYIAIGTNHGVAVWHIGVKSTPKMLGSADTGCVAWSPDGHYLAVSAEGNLVVIDFGTGKQRILSRPHLHDLWSIDWSSDGSRLATGSFDQHAKITDVQSGKELQDLAHNAGIREVAFSPNDLELACASEGQEIVVWDVNSGKQKGRFFGHTEWINSVDWSPDGKRFVSGSKDRSVRTWNLEATKESNVPVEDNAVNFNRGLVAYRKDDKIEIQAFGNPNVAYVVPGRRKYWSVAGDRLAAEDNGTVQIVDSDTGENRSAFSIKDGKLAVGWSGDDKLLLSRNADIVTIWDVGSGQLRCSLPIKSRDELNWQPGGKLLGAWNAKQFAVWDAGTGRKLVTIENSSRPSHWQYLVWSPDGEQVATNHWSYIAIWEARSGRILHKLSGHVPGRFLKCITWSSDGSKLASGGWDQTIKIWNPQTGREMCSIDAHISKVRNIAFSPDGRRLASSDWLGTIRLWDTNTGDEILVLAEGPTDARQTLAWSNDGHALINCGESGLKLFDASLGYANAMDKKLNNEIADTWFKQGIARAMSRRSDDSNEAFGQAEQLAGKTAWSYAARASKYHDLGLDGNAVADLENSLQLRPDDAVLNNALAWLLTNRRDDHTRDSQRAKQIAERLTRAWPKEGHFWATLGLADYRLGNWEQAAVSLKKAAELSRNHRARIYLILAMADARLGDANGASDWLKRAKSAYADEIGNSLLESNDVGYRQDWDCIREEATTLLKNN